VSAQRSGPSDIYLRTTSLNEQKQKKMFFTFRVYHKNNPKGLSYFNI